MLILLIMWATHVYVANCNIVNRHVLQDAQTALHLAVQNSHIAVVDTLIVSGANVNTADKVSAVHEFLLSVAIT